MCSGCYAHVNSAGKKSVYIIVFWKISPQKKTLGITCRYWYNIIKRTCENSSGNSSKYKFDSSA